jgi:putative membrane protein
MAMITNSIRMSRAGNAPGTALRLGLACAALCIGMAAGAQTGAGSGSGTGTGSGSGSGTTTGQAASGAPSGGTSGERAAGKQAKLARADTAFMKQAAENNHAEIESSRLAVQKASDPAVKAFAQQMVADHGKTGQELAALAGAKGVELPDGPSMMQKAKLKLLETADGADFDRRYSESMGLAAHRDTIKLFQKASTDARDPDVKAFAAKTLPALQQHLEMAQKLPVDKGAKDNTDKKR